MPRCCRPGQRDPAPLPELRFSAAPRGRWSHAACCHTPHPELEEELPIKRCVFPASPGRLVDGHGESNRVGCHACMPRWPDRDPNRPGRIPCSAGTRRRHPFPPNHERGRDVLRVRLGSPLLITIGVGMIDCSLGSAGQLRGVRGLRHAGGVSALHGQASRCHGCRASGRVPCQHPRTASIYVGTPVCRGSMLPARWAARRRPWGGRTSGSSLPGPPGGSSNGRPGESPTRCLACRPGCPRFPRPSCQPSTVAPCCPDSPLLCRDPERPVCGLRERRDGRPGVPLPASGRDPTGGSGAKMAACQRLSTRRPFSEPSREPRSRPARPAGGARKMSRTAGGGSLP